MNLNTLEIRTEPSVLFIDMNSFFASCEQQENYWLRGRPVAVCVYTGKNGCVIAPSIEAKRKGVKTGMRLNEAMLLCPELVPVETHPARYRNFHKKIIAVLRKYSTEVIPKSIDEAVMDLHKYKLIYKDIPALARQIKADIKNEVGDWLKCSIGIAPNAFLAKLASDVQKPDGLVVIDPSNIDQVLSKLKLRDLPGIASGMEERLMKAGITTPLQLRYTPPEKLQMACKSVVGLHWHYRLNFAEVDLSTHGYKSMQAMRHLSKDQRASLSSIKELLLSLCMKLESRMVDKGVHCRSMGVYFSYVDGYRWSEHVLLEEPLQDGTALLNVIRYQMEKYQKHHHCEDLLNEHMSSMSVNVADFTADEAVQYGLFDNNERKDHLRKVVYGIKEKFGKDKIMKAVEASDEKVLQDVIGFGSIKDIED